MCGLGLITAASLALAKEGDGTDNRDQVQVRQVSVSLRNDDGPISEWPVWISPEPLLQSESPDPVVQAQLDDPVLPWADRASCEEIRGTEYYSDSEREWFLGNCKEVLRKSTNVAPKQLNVGVDYREHTPQPAVTPGGTSFKVTHYGASYNGYPLGCTRKPYSSGDYSIVATAWRPDGSRTFPCGTVLRLSGPFGTITGVVQDACPGCGWYHLDLSEAGILAVCGGYGTCTVQVTEE